jgi:hypothetical protein
VHAHPLEFLTALRELVLPLELLAIPVSLLVNLLVNLRGKYRGDLRAQLSAPRLVVHDFGRAILIFTALSAVSAGLVLMWLTIVAVDTPAALIGVLILAPAAWVVVRGLPLMIAYRIIERLSQEKAPVGDGAGSVTEPAI